MTPTMSLVLDLVLVGLLAATIAYAIILNKQIVRLRDSRSELAELVQGLNAATAKADAGVRGMRKSADETGEQLQRAIDQATALRDELAFIMEAGEALADRLGNSGGGHAAAERPRPLPPRSAPPAMAPAAAARQAPSARSLIDDTLLVARAEAARRPEPGQAAAAAQAGLSHAQQVQAHVQAAHAQRRAAEAGQAPAEPTRSREAHREGQDGMSRAERELLEAIENHR